MAKTCLTNKLPFDILNRREVSGPSESAYVSSNPLFAKMLCHNRRDRKYADVPQYASIDGVSESPLNKCPSQCLRLVIKIQVD